MLSTTQCVGMHYISFSYPDVPGLIRNVFDPLNNVEIALSEQTVGAVHAGPNSFVLFRVALLFFDKCRKLDRAVIQDFNTRSGPSNSHRSYRRINLHVACMCDIACDESERSFG
jgi:hypothetical protein